MLKDKQAAPVSFKIGEYQKMYKDMFELQADDSSLYESPELFKKATSQMLRTKFATVCTPKLTCLCRGSTTF